MRQLWPILSTLAIALWLGSLAHTLLTVSTLFATFDKAVSDVAVKAAPAVFAVTEKFHLALAVVGVVSVFLWRKRACSRPRKLIFFLLIGALLLAIVQIAGVSPRMETLRAAGDSGGALFKQLHGVSSVQYLMQTAALLAAAALLPWAFDERACALKQSV
jgi:hypothetical protein